MLRNVIFTWVILICCCNSLDQWIKPHVDISTWEFHDLSCKARDDSDDKVLTDSVEAGKRVCSIFKEPTVTPSAAQAKQWGLKKAWGSPNGAMRKGWNGITISRDTIMIEGVKMGFDKPVFFDVRFDIVWKLILFLQYGN